MNLTALLLGENKRFAVEPHLGHSTDQSTSFPAGTISMKLCLQSSLVQIKSNVGIKNNFTTIISVKMGVICKISEEVLSELVKTSNSKKEVIHKLGLFYGNHHNKKLDSVITKYNLDISHFNQPGEFNAHFKNRLNGLIFGQWTVLSYNKESTKIGIMWNCQCSCGNTAVVASADLTNGKSTRCRDCGYSEVSKKNRKYTATDKYCPWCKVYKPLESFHLDNKRKSRKSAYCKSCYTIVRYNLTVDKYNALLAAQNGLCAIAGCSNKPTDIDHDHSCCSGAYSCGKCVRGLLCRSCNLALGLINDDIVKVAGLQTYLSEFHIR